MTITITEALAELKTIKARLAKKREGIMPYIARDNRVKDALEKSEGGSVEFIKRERQAIGDLETRFVKIRCAIQLRNLEMVISIDGVAKTVAEWLNWRRDLSKDHVEFLNRISKGVQGLRNEIVKKGFRMTDKESEAGPNDIIVHLNEKALVEEQDEITKLLGDLDGRLSLFNATTTIDV